MLDSAKACSECRLVKPLEDFHRRVTNADGHQYVCKSCAIAKAMKWDKDHPERFRQNQRRHRLKREYGITPEGYATMLAEQGGRCAICRVSAAESPLHVDHDHESGRVRGLLCMPCNAFIGRIGEDTTVLRRAIAYLAGHARLF